MADGHRVGEYWKCHNSPTNGPTVTQLWCSHPILFSTCLPWCGYHGNGRCLAKAHWTFSSCGRLEAEHMNQFWWNLVYNSKFGQNDSHDDQILTFLKFKMADGSCCENILNAITRLPMNRLGRNLGGRIPSCSQYWKCYNFLWWDRLGWLMGGCVQAIRMLQNRFLGIGRYC